MVIAPIPISPPQHWHENFIARSATYTSSLLEPDGRLGSTSTTNGLRGAHVICSTIRERGRLRKLHSLLASGISRISTDSSSVSMERHLVSFVGSPALPIWRTVSVPNKIIVGTTISAPAVALCAP